MDPEVEALYGLPLAEFTKGRDALAKERTRRGDKAAAAEVKALRKPSLTAWALNQLARRHPDDVTALLESGARLRQAQTAALEGDPSELREASREEALLVQGLADRALAILGAEGRAATGAQHERLAATLRAAATDAGRGEDLRRGTLTTELSPAGFGFDELADAVTPSSPVPSKKAADVAEARARRKAEAEARRVQEEAARAEARAARLHEEAARSEERARAAVAAAEEAAERARALREEAGTLAPDASKGREG